MSQKTVRSLWIVLASVLCFGIRAQASERPVKTLPDYLAESGIPTEQEVATVEDWLKTIIDGEDGKPSSTAWLNRWIGTGLPFSFRYDGKKLLENVEAWRFQAGEPQQQANVETRDLVWLHTETGLKVTWRLRRFLNYPAVDSLLTFENTGGKDTLLIEDVQNLDLMLNQPPPSEKKTYTIYGCHGGRCGEDDLMPFRRTLAQGDGSSTRFGSRPHSSNQELPFFNIECSENHGVLTGLGWSGSWLASFQVRGDQLDAKAGLIATRFCLHPGEKVRGPRVLLLFWNGRRLHGNNMLRRLLYEHYLPRLPNGKPHEPLVSVNTCFTYHGKGGYLEEASEKSLSALVEPFIDLGAEAFVIDAGYYNYKKWWGDIDKSKDYSYSKERFPHGFRSISDPLAKAGVAFGIWFWAEVIGDMGVPENRDRFLAIVDDYVKNQGMAMYRQDGGFNPPPGAPDRRGVPEMKHYAGLYAMQDELHRRYPFLIREGCCGGGRRIDLESLSRFLWHQKSDSWFKTVSDQSGLGGANLYLPGGVINVPTEATDNFGLWSSFAGQLCLAWHPLDKDFPMELAKKQVSLYKRVRPLLSGDFYPLTDCTLDKPWLAYQFHRTDLDRGFALIFKRAAAAGDSFVFAPKSLDPKSRYVIRCEGSGLEAVYTGAELAKGIPLTLKNTPEAELVIYKKQP